jgi:uncharacterized membrane protein (DUF4010 family)
MMTNALYLRFLECACNFEEDSRPGFVDVVFRVVSYLQRKDKVINLNLDNPLTLKRTGTFALVISASLILVTLIVRLFGTDGIYLTSVIGGLFSVRAITLAIGSVANSGGIPIEAASLSILLALTTNMVAKLVLIHRVGSGRLLVICAPILTLMLASGLAVHWIQTLS